MGKVWVDIFKIGAEIHGLGARVVRITDSFASRLIANFKRAKARGESFPVLREHESHGWQYGEVHALRAHGGYVQAALSFLRREDREAYNVGMLREFSPGFVLDFTDPHTGDQIGPHLIEVSFTAIAFQRNLRPPQATNPGVRLSTTDYLTAPPTEDPRMRNGKVELSAGLRRKIADDARREAENAQLGFDLASTLDGEPSVVELHRAAVEAYGEARADEIVTAWAVMKRDPHLWTVSEAAEFLQLSVDRVGRLATAGEIPSVKFGGTRRYSPSGLRSWAAAGGER